MKSIVAGKNNWHLVILCESGMGVAGLLFTSPATSKPANMPTNSGDTESSLDKAFQRFKPTIVHNAKTKCMEPSEKVAMRLTEPAWGS